MEDSGDGIPAVVQKCQQIISEDKDIPYTVAAFKALTAVLEEATVTTIMELREKIKNATDQVIESFYEEYSVVSGCKLFLSTLIEVSASRSFSSFSSCRDAVLTAAKRWIEISQTSRERIADTASSFIQTTHTPADTHSSRISCEGMRIMTLGYSRVVLAVVKKLISASPSPVSLTVLQGSDVDQTRTLLSKLRQQSVKIRIITDGDVISHIKSVDFVLCGAECVFKSGGVLNRQGTHQLAFIAHLHSVPVYIAAELYKFDSSFPLDGSDIRKEEGKGISKLQESIGIPGKTREEMARGKCITSDSVAVGCRREAEVEYVCYSSDYTPPGYISLIFTEYGALTPGGVAVELMKVV
ncbi:Initiation factor 2B-related like protein [Aduncisulcus paluster]|uniref:Translation initiation factor eIF2B subunit alpha n=1 Tax=Aduncisulcus paluster TaxID=2918883 RepID=A0ABQ5K476_9EUKA|nr:Initiation factor 2B-related like protein [Aduncisulcus paluster]